MTSPADAASCRCHGTGAYTAEIPLADAVVLMRRVCLEHLADRTRLKDTTTGRIGEVMAVIKSTGRIYLRPPGGGMEWTADVGSLEPTDPA